GGAAHGPPALAAAGEPYQLRPVRGEVRAREPGGEVGEGFLFEGDVGVDPGEPGASLGEQVHTRPRYWGASTEGMIAERAARCRAARWEMGASSECLRREFVRADGPRLLLGAGLHRDRHPDRPGSGVGV